MIGRILGTIEVVGLIGLFTHFVTKPLEDWLLMVCLIMVVIPISIVIIEIICSDKKKIQKENETNKTTS